MKGERVVVMADRSLTRDTTEKHGREEGRREGSTTAQRADGLVGWSAWLGSLKAFGSAPLFFFGLGIYRAWIELAYVRPLVETPAHQIAGHDVYDISMVALLLICAVFAKRLIPLYKKKALLWLCLLLMTGGTLLSSLSLFVPSLATTLPAFIAAISAGLGTGLIILYWSELYGCLNPLRVAFFYSGSLLLGAGIIFLFSGLIKSYYIGGVLLLPMLSLVCLYGSYRHIEPENLPKQTWSSFSFPWKPTALMAVYGFAFGMQEPQLYVYSGPHSSSGTVIAAAIVFLGIVLIPSRFNIAVTYRFALPLMVCALLLVPSFSLLGENVAGVCASMSFASFSILTMLILSSISYRFGVGAVWLFGIERGLRAIFMLAGRYVSNYLSDGALGPVLDRTVLTAVVILLVVVATLILLSEKELASKWGITLLGERQGDGDAFMQQALTETCSRIGREYGLSSREEEVLLLLARRQSLSSIEKELFIANGTVKAHIRHIYGKLGIHTRKELFRALGIDAE
jgi:DNA-binding CsgD family transcriptional regulator